MIKTATAVNRKYHSCNLKIQLQGMAFRAFLAFFSAEILKKSPSFFSRNANGGAPKGFKKAPRFNKKYKYKYVVTPPCGKRGQKMAKMWETKTVMTSRLSFGGTLPFSF